MDVTRDDIRLSDMKTRVLVLQLQMGSKSVQGRNTVKIIIEVYIIHRIKKQAETILSWYGNLSYSCAQESNDHWFCTPFFYSINQISITLRRHNFRKFISIYFCAREITCISSKSLLVIEFKWKILYSQPTRQLDIRALNGNYWRSLLEWSNDMSFSIGTRL